MATPIINLTFELRPGTLKMRLIVVFARMRETIPISQFDFVQKLRKYKTNNYTSTSHTLINSITHVTKYSSHTQH